MTLVSLVQKMFVEFQQSIKSPDTEEKLDLYFYRPFGFVIAKVANVFRMTPTQLSILGLISGVMAGYFYLDLDNTNYLIIGTVLFLLSGIFDSSDGQLARLSGKYTPFGMVIDGICDATVTVSIYVFCLIPLVPVYGYWIFAFGAFSAHMHSTQCAVLDFFNREYIFFGYGKHKDGTYWNPNLEDAKAEVTAAKSKLERVFKTLRYNWLKQGHIGSSRTSAQRTAMRDIIVGASQGVNREQFMQAYRDHNRLLIRFWRLMGPNFHTLMIIIFIFLGRFDLYMITIDVSFLSFALLVLRAIQKRQDHKLLQKFGLA